MPETDIGSAEITDLSNSIKDFSVAAESTDGALDQKETRWQSKNWTINYGYYKKIPELKRAIKTKALWTIGAGFEADEQTTLLLDTIKGNGKDSFNGIIKNMVRVYMIDGDSYAEIMRDKDILANLKPLDPSSIVVVQNMQGKIIRYEQVSKFKGVPNRKIKPEDMFHLSRDRTADEMHGESVIDAVEDLILARNEAISDWRRVLHRNVEPLFIFHLDTDDPVEVAAIKRKYNDARKEGENMFVPKGTVEPEAITIAANATMNPVAWITMLGDAFFQAVNVPQIIVGNAKEFTDASGKIVYLSYEQSVKDEQLYVEEQVLGQLNIEINLTFPASLQSDAISDTPAETDQVEEEPIEEAVQPDDTEAELEGKK